MSTAVKATHFVILYFANVYTFFARQLKALTVLLSLHFGSAVAPHTRGPRALQNCQDAIHCE